MTTTLIFFSAQVGLHRWTWDVSVFLIKKVCLVLWNEMGMTLFPCEIHQREPDVSKILLNLSLQDD